MWPRPMGDLDREFVRGLTLPLFDRVGTSTLRAWLRYWKAVRDGRQRPNPGDTRSMAPEQIVILSREIEMREREEFAGPNRSRSWRSG